MMKLPSQVHMVLDCLEQAGHEAYLVGGAVRDFLRGCTAVNDWDIATDACPEQVKSALKEYRLVETGLKHGTVTAIIDHMPLEITTYHIAGGDADRQHSEQVFFSRSLNMDLAHRDFTMNALAYHPTTGIVDLFGGIDDIKAGLIRCVGNPEERFQEDGLRILRALRFASVYEMEIEGQTAEAIHRGKHLCTKIAAERLQTELTRLLCGRGAQSILREYADVIAGVIPESAPMFGFQQHNPHHNRDVWEHTLAVVAATPSTPILRWAAFLHDIGKPACFAIHEDGMGHFYGHAGKSVALADQILKRLRFDTASRLQIITLIQYHDLPIPAQRKPVLRLMRKLGVETVRQLIALHIADTVGQSALCKDRIQEYERVETVLNQVLEEESCFSLRDLAVNGNDMQALGLTGREIGLALEHCLSAVIDGRISNEKGPLLQLIQTSGRLSQNIQ